MWGLSLRGTLNNERGAGSHRCRETGGGQLFSSRRGTTREREKRAIEEVTVGEGRRTPAESGAEVERHHAGFRGAKKKMPKMEKRKRTWWVAYSRILTRSL